MSDLHRDDAERHTHSVKNDLKASRGAARSPPHPFHGPLPALSPVGSTLHFLAASSRGGVMFP